MTNQLTQDTVYHGALTIFQSSKGYRVSLDPLLLAGFIRRPSLGKVVDLGAGCGVLSMTIARFFRTKEIHGIELQESLVRNFRRALSVNGPEMERVTVHHADIRDLATSGELRNVQTVVSNPPFFENTSGQPNPNQERAAARHELNGTFIDFLKAATKMLCTGGRFFIIFPARRLVELLTGLRNYSLEPKRLRLVYPSVESEANLVMLEAMARARPGLKILSPLWINAGKTGYSEEVNRLLIKPI